MANGTDERPPGSASAPGTPQRRHFILDGVTEVESYRSPQQRGKRPSVPERDRQRHGNALRRQIDALHPQAEAAHNAQQQAGLDEGLGLQIEFESFPGWTIGKQSRHRGSLHSDIWRGSAADLASRAVMAVYPTLGWWKSRPGLKRYERAARYALVVSITAPEVDVDLYTAVANKSKPRWRWDADGYFGHYPRVPAPDAGILVQTCEDSWHRR